MVKLGLVTLGVIVASVPIGYRIYRDFGTNKSVISFDSAGKDIKDKSKLIESSTSSPNLDLIVEDQFTEIQESISTSKDADLSENQQKILNWAKTNGGCKVRVYNTTASKYMEIQELEKDFDLTGLEARLDSWIGACQVSNPSYGIRRGADDAIEGIMIKKQTNGQWDMEEEEESELES